MHYRKIQHVLDWNDVDIKLTSTTAFLTFISISVRVIRLNPAKKRSMLATHDLTDSFSLIFPFPVVAIYSANCMSISSLGAGTPCSRSGAEF